MKIAINGLGRIGRQVLRICTEDSSAPDVIHVNEAMRKASRGRMKGILAVAPAPLVSRDVIGNKHSSVFSADDTFVKDGNLVKVLSWYDNEWGFSQRSVDMMGRMLQTG